MKEYMTIKDGKISCRISDNYISNKKVIYCKNCENQFAGVCRYELDKNY